MEVICIQGFSGFYKGCDTVIMFILIGSTASFSTFLRAGIAPSWLASNNSYIGMFRTLFFSLRPKHIPISGWKAIVCPHNERKEVGT